MQLIEPKLAGLCNLDCRFYGWQIVGKNTDKVASPDQLMQCIGFKQILAVDQTAFQSDATEQILNRTLACTVIQGFQGGNSTDSKSFRVASGVDFQQWVFRLSMPADHHKKPLAKGLFQHAENIIRVSFPEYGCAFRKPYRKQSFCMKATFLECSCAFAFFASSPSECNKPA